VYTPAKVQSLLTFHVVQRYIVLTGAQSLYTYFIEGETIFIGKRKTYAKRVETERIKVEAKSHPAKWSSVLYKKPSAASAPSYQLSMSYVRSANSGKIIIHKVSRHSINHSTLDLRSLSMSLCSPNLRLQGKERFESSYATFFDSEGKMDIGKFETWVAAAMARVMGIRSEKENHNPTNH
jgi:signal peptidase complex subunit 2